MVQKIDPNRLDLDLPDFWTDSLQSLVCGMLPKEDVFRLGRCSRREVNWFRGYFFRLENRKCLVANLRLGVVAQTCPDTSGSSTCIGISYIYNIYIYILYRIILTYSPSKMYNRENMTMRKLFQTLATIPCCAASSKGIPLKDLHNGPPQCFELTFSVKVSMLIVGNPCFVHLPLPETTMVDIEPLPGTWFPYRTYHFHCSTAALGGVVEGERKVIRSYSLLVLAACQEASSDSPTPKDK